MRRLFIGVLVLMSIVAGGCGKTAKVAGTSKADEWREVVPYKRVVFQYKATGEYMMTIEGLLTLAVNDIGDLIVTAKTQDDVVFNHCLGPASDLTYVADALLKTDPLPIPYKATFRRPGE